ncbi:MAG: hypothetical protein ABI706_08610 [Ilumatobacteraceae bacterium]
MRRTLVILGLCAALAACSNSDGSKAASTSAPSATSTASPATSPAAVSATSAVAPVATDAAAIPDTTVAVAPPGTVDPCSIVTIDDVAAAFGGSVAAGVINPDNGGCDYEITGQTNTGPSGILTQVSIEFTGADFGSYEKTKVVFPDVVKVDGVGSEAYYLSFGSQLHVNIGGQEMVISGLFPGDDTAVQAEVVAFGKTVVGKL